MKALGVGDSSGVQDLDVSGWKGALKGPDADMLRKQVQTQLTSSAMRDSDLYNLLVMPLVRGDPTQSLTRDVFVAGFKRLGYLGPTGMLLTLFKRIDRDGSGIIGFSELREWMTGRMGRVRQARSIHLLSGRNDDVRFASWVRVRVRVCFCIHLVSATVMCVRR